MWRTHRRRQGRDREASEEAIAGTTVTQSGVWQWRWREEILDRFMRQHWQSLRLPGCRGERERESGKERERGADRKIPDFW